ncbi:hypothetical protein [Burkholderia ubonensis]|uniref:hypothetical protein n=1 Tax=Burkholderia ubonensis TaxID=101571 RepID=UPI003F751080
MIGVSATASVAAVIGPGAAPTVASGADVSTPAVTMACASDRISGTAASAGANAGSTIASSWPMSVARSSAMRADSSVSTADGTETSPADAAGHIDAAAPAAAAAPASGAAARAASAGVALASDAH